MPSEVQGQKRYLTAEVARIGQTQNPIHVAYDLIAVVRGCRLLIIASRVGLGTGQSVFHVSLPFVCLASRGAQRAELREQANAPLVAVLSQPQMSLLGVCTYVCTA